ncbi:hypothetical protein F4680DRAFT_451742 [Xylaria scruposa]|nr:hypothetical protein F4680DRAFT_451742 [Xylaria scruposa]
MSKGLMTQDEAALALLAYVFSGAISSPKGKGVGYALMKATQTTFSWSVALEEDIDGPSCWQIQLLELYLIGELIAHEIGGRVVFSIGPDQHHGLVGPFTSVCEYFRAHIRSSLIALEKQEGIEEYKERFIDRIRDFVDNHLHNSPAVIEDIPIIVAMHADLGPHNIILSSQKFTEIHAVID